MLIDIDLLTEKLIKNSFDFLSGKVALCIIIIEKINGISQKKRFIFCDILLIIIPLSQNYILYDNYFQKNTSNHHYRFSGIW